MLQACDACADTGMAYSVIVQCADCVVFPQPKLSRNKRTINVSDNDSVTSQAQHYGRVSYALQNSTVFKSAQEPSQCHCDSDGSNTVGGSEIIRVDQKRRNFSVHILLSWSEVLRGRHTLRNKDQVASKLEICFDDGKLLQRGSGGCLQSWACERCSVSVSTLEPSPID